MRRRRHWLKWSLAVVVLSFVVFYIPVFLRDQGTGAVSTDVVARVEGRVITAGEFSRTYQSQLQAYRTSYGGNLDEKLLKQLGVDQQILQQMIDDEAALIEAERLGLRASDDEIREHILTMPAFQENGRFIGDTRYLQLLRMQRPPLSPAEFEQSLGQSILLDKLRGVLTAWVTISDAEVEQEYRFRNEKVKLELVTFQAETFRTQVTATDAEIAGHFETRKADYRIGEKRKIRYLAVDVQALRTKIAVAPQEVERYYEDNNEQYTVPEQVRASHILFKTENKDEAIVRKQAEQVLAMAKAGADFAELAKKYSEDESNAQHGGDLDYFGRDRMVPEFDEVAFKMQPGQMSDLVKTQYGFHIIKVVDKKPSTSRTLEEVRQQIEEQLKWERAQTQAGDLAAAMGSEIGQPADLDRVAKTRGLTVQQSGLFGKEEPIAGLGPSPEVSARAFELKQGEVSSAVRSAQGYAFITVVAVQEPYVPKLDEVKDKVREDVIRKKSADMAIQKAKELAGRLKNAKDFQAVAKSAGLEVKTTDFIARGTAIPDLGISAAIDTAAFSLPTGAVSDPIVADSGTAIVRVLERQEVVASEMAAAKDSMRTELLIDRRSRFYSAYMAKAKQRMRIEVNRKTLEQLTA